MMKRLILFAAPLAVIADALHQYHLTGCAGISGIGFLAIAVVIGLIVHDNIKEETNGNQKSKQRLKQEGSIQID